jgi:outer membrane protein assembly factor BamB
MRTHALRLAFALTLLSAGAAPAGAESPMFRGGPDHAGAVDEQVPARADRVLWRFQARGRILSSPAVVGGTVYAGSEEGKLYALDARTGQLRWAFQTRGAIHSSPAVAGGAVVFLSRDGNAYAVDTATGAERWRFATGGERWFEARGVNLMSPRGQTIPDVWDLLLSSPAVWQGKVIFGSGDGSVYALDLATGAQAWRFRTGDVVHASPAVAEGRVFVGSFDSWFYALDAASGKELWRFKTGSRDLNHVGVQSSAAVAGGTVFFGCRDAEVYALDASTGALRWHAGHDGTWVDATPAVAGGKVFYGTSIPSRFIARDAATGALLWSRDEKGLVFGSAAVGRDAVLVPSFAGTLTSRSLDDGAVRWEFRTDASRRNELKLLKPDGALDLEAVFGGSLFEDVYYFERSFLSFEKLLSVGSIVSSPVLVDGVVYFGATDGGLYAVGR